MTQPLFARRSTPALIGVVHLPPLPGAPGAPASLDAAMRHGLSDVEALLTGGVDALILENLGDAPFAKDDVDDITVAAMTRIVTAAVQRAGDVPVGVNVLRNDALAALAVASAAGARFIRVNVLVGAMVTDQGVIEGKARAVAEARARWAPDVQVAADVLVKHAAPLAPTELHEVARDTWTRAGADALILTGSGTGAPTDAHDFDRARAAAPDAPLWLGSGLTPEGAAEVRTRIDAAIVGTWLHADADLRAPVDAHRVRRMADALRG